MAACSPARRAPAPLNPADPLRIYGLNGQAVVTLQPFSLSFTDRAGRPVLSEIVGATPAPTAADDLITSDLGPAPTTAQAAAPPYAPLAYTVGQAQTLAAPSGFNQGDLVAATATGTIYGPTNVLAVRYDPASAVLTLGTNDPAGRRIHLRVAAAPGGFDVSATLDNPQGVVAFADSFATGPDAWQVSARSDHLRYHVVLGSAPDVIAALTSDTGRQVEPPAWALGPTLDRARPSLVPISADAYAALVQSDLTQLGQDGLPITAYRIEGWTDLPPTTFASFVQ